MACSGRWGAAGMPLERSKDFKNSTRRARGAAAARGLRASRWSCSSPSSSVTLLVHRAEDPRRRDRHHRRRASRAATGIDFGELHRTLLDVAAIYIASARPRATQGVCSPGVVQRAMFRLRSDVEDKLNRMPLRYVDRQPRGDLLSRVTNDIDNLAQSLQQTLSQLLTSSLTLIGVAIMMITISPLLALVALVTIPLSIFTIRFDHQALEDEVHRPVAPHRHAERAGRGGVHRALARQGLRPPGGRRAAVQRQERRAVRGQLRRPVHLRHDPAGDDVPRQPELRRHRARSAACGSRRAS